MCNQCYDFFPVLYIGEIISITHFPRQSSAFVRAKACLLHDAVLSRFPAREWNFLNFSPCDFSDNISKLNSALRYARSKLPVVNHFSRFTLDSRFRDRFYIGRRWVYASFLEVFQLSRAITKRCSAISWEGESQSIVPQRAVLCRT